MEDIKVSHVICNIFYDFVNFLLIMIFPKIWIVNNTCHRSKHAKNFGYRWWLSCIFFFWLKLCYFSCVVYAKLYFFVFLMIHESIFQINENRDVVWSSVHERFFFFIWNHLNSTLYPPYLLIHFYGRCFGLLLGLLHLGIRRVLL